MAAAKKPAAQTKTAPAAKKPAASGGKAKGPGEEGQEVVCMGAF